MQSSGTRKLIQMLRAGTLRPIAQWDAWLSLLGGVGGGVVAFSDPSRVINATAVATGVAGAVFGAIIAATAIMTAFMDEAFLRKLIAIGTRPFEYLQPLVVTGLIGCAALLVDLVLAVGSPCWPRPLLVALGSLGGWLTSWAVLSLAPCLATLVQFAELKADAAEQLDPQN